MENQNKSATVYDFIHPGHKLNKQWPVLDLVNDRVATAFGTSLAERLQVNWQGRSDQTVRCKYAECVSEMGGTCLVHELSLAPMQGVVWFCMDTSVLAAIVDSYFGGEAILLPLEEPRDLSRTERRVMNHIIDAVLAGVAQGWSMVMPLSAALIRPIDVKRLVNTALEQVMVRSEMTLQFGALEVPCQLIYPFEMLNAFGEKLEYETLAVSNQDQRFSKAMQAELMNCEIDVRGVVSETRITLGKLLELKKGDFIPLRDVQTVSFKTHNMPLFDARVGNSNGRVSASLSRWHLPVSH